MDSSRAAPRTTARQAGHDWPARLRRLVFLGTPLHGAPLERGGHRLDYVMELSPYVAPFTRSARRAAQASWTCATAASPPCEQEFVPLPEGVACYAAAAIVGSRRNLVGERLVGDGLVPLDSALGQHADPARTFAIPAGAPMGRHQMGHLELLHRREVYTQLRKWLREPA